MAQRVRADSYLVTNTSFFACGIHRHGQGAWDTCVPALYTVSLPCPQGEVMSLRGKAGADTSC
jgi:hypothetical protein